MSERDTPVQSPNSTPTQTPRMSPVQDLVPTARNSTRLDRDQQAWRSYYRSLKMSSSWSKQVEYHAQTMIVDRQQKDDALVAKRTQLDDLSQTLDATHLAPDEKPDKAASSYLQDLAPAVKNSKRKWEQINDLVQTLRANYFLLHENYHKARPGNASYVEMASELDFVNIQTLWCCCQCDWPFNGYVYNLSCISGCTHWRCDGCTLEFVEPLQGDSTCR